MSRENNQALVTTLLSAGKLKGLKRAGWVEVGVPQPESVADHSWRMVLMVVLLASPNLDSQKLMKMAVLHDLGEAIDGDIIAERGAKQISNRSEKHKSEMAAISAILQGATNKDELMTIVSEYNDQITPEAKFVKQIDKLEMVLQALEYEQGGHPAHLFDEFWENAEQYLAGNTLESIFRELQNMRKSTSDRF